MDHDRLQGLLARFSVSAQVFHSGLLCGITDFEATPGMGQLHLIRVGPVQAHHGGRARPEHIDGPSLVFYPRPLHHRFVTDAEAGAQMACANIAIGAGDASPLAQALPPVVVVPLAELPGAGPVLDLLFDEAFATRCGRRHVVDRLFEVVLVLVLRHLIDGGRIDEGPLAGLAHPQLAKALIAMHDNPQAAWTLPRLAACAGMSRSRFAEVFAHVVGVSPIAYLAAFRLALAADLLRRGHPLALVADEVGYASATVLSRAFTARHGMSPREWRKEPEGGAGNKRA